MDDIVSVLVATGDDVLQPVLSQMADVKILGLAVRTEQVIDMVEDLLPKVTIIADFMDPGMALAQELSCHFSKTRVIYIITNDQEQETKEALVGLGIYDFLPHTFKKSELHKMIQNPRGLHHLVEEGLQLEHLIGGHKKLGKINQLNRRSQVDSDHDPHTNNQADQLRSYNHIQPNRNFAPSTATGPMQDFGLLQDSGPVGNNRTVKTVNSSRNLLARFFRGIRPEYKQTLDTDSQFGQTNTVAAQHHNKSGGSPMPNPQERNQNYKGNDFPQLHDQATYQQPKKSTPGDNLELTSSAAIENSSNQNTNINCAKLPIKVLKQQIVAFWSAKPGTGKTFLAVNTALSLARSGARVVIVDGDLLNLSVGISLNLMDEKRTLERALKCDHISEIDDCFIYHPRFPTLAVLSGSEQCRPENYCSVTKENVEKLLEYLRLKFDVIIFDTASDLQTVTSFVALQQATKIILLTNQDYAQVFATKRIFSLLKRLNISYESSYVVMNGEVQKCRLTRHMIEEMLGIKVNLVLPFLPVQVLNSIIDSNPVSLQDGSDTVLIRQQLQLLADEIFPVSLAERVSILGNLTRLIRKKESISYG